MKNYQNKSCFTKYLEENGAAMKDTNGNALNVVPKYVQITMKYIGAGEIPSFESNEEIKVTNLDNNTFEIEAFGKASHAAFPENGKNAITIIFKYLLKYFKSEYIETLMSREARSLPRPSVRRARRGSSRSIQ